MHTVEFSEALTAHFEVLVKKTGRRRIEEMHGVGEPSLTQKRKGAHPLPSSNDRGRGCRSEIIPKKTEAVCKNYVLNGVMSENGG